MNRYLRHVLPGRRRGGLWRLRHELRHGIVVMRREQLDARHPHPQVAIAWLSCSCGKTKRVRP